MIIALMLISNSKLIFQIVFNSGKTGNCTRFSVDLLAHGAVSCLNQAPHPDKNDMDGISIRDNTTIRTLDEINRNGRSIDPNGYK